MNSKINSRIYKLESAENAGFEEINPEVAGIEPLREDLYSRYNPFTKEFEKVPLNWKIKRDARTGEWHYRPDH